MARQAILSSTRPKWGPVYSNETGNREANAAGNYANQTVATIAITPLVRAIAITGQPPVVTKSGSFIITPLVGLTVITGQPPTVTATSVLSITPSAGAPAITGQAPTATRSQVVPAARQAVIRGRGGPIYLNQTGARQALTAARTFANDNIAASSIVQPSAGALAVTRSAPVISLAIPIVPSSSSQSLTALAFSFNVGFVYTPSVGSPTITGQALAVSVDFARVPAVGALAATGQAPVVTITIGDITCQPATGLLVIADAGPPNVTAGGNRSLSPDSSTLVATGTTPIVSAVFIPSAATLAITRQAPIVTAAGNAYGQPAAGALFIQIQGPPNVTVSSGPSSLSPDSADVLIVGEAPDVSLGNQVFVTPAAASDLAIIGEAPDIIEQSFDFIVTPDPAPELVLAGERPDIGLGEFHFAAPDAGSVTVAGRRPVVTVENNLPVGPSETELIRALGGVTRIRAATGVSGIQATTFSPTEA